MFSRYVLHFLLNPPGINLINGFSIFNIIFGVSNAEKL